MQEEDFATVVVGRAVLTGRVRPDRRLLTSAQLAGRSASSAQSNLKENLNCLLVTYQTDTLKM